MGKFGARIENLSRVSWVGVPGKTVIACIGWDQDDLIE